MEHGIMEQNKNKINKNRSDSLILLYLPTYLPTHIHTYRYFSDDDY